MRPHPDVDLLALAALGEPSLDDDASAHVASCGRCRTTLEELRGTVTAVRGPRDEAVADQPVPVPAHIWQGIAAELELDPAVRPASIGPTVVPASRPSGAPDDAAAPLRHGRRHTDPSPALAPTGPSTPAVLGPPATTGATSVVDEGAASRAGSSVRALPRSRRSSAGPLLAVAAAGLVIGVAGTALLVGLDDSGPGEPEVLAATDLAAFGDGEGTPVAGSARLASRPEASDGDDRVLHVWLSDVPDTGEDFLEAWLIDPATGDMVSLGPVSRDSSATAVAELVVPRGLDVATYALVDVSAEPLDGDPTHSGASLVRGTLTT